MMEDNFSEKTVAEYFNMIQRVITRLAQNSFQIKAWSATIFTAILVVTFSFINILIFIVLLIVMTLFWYLDSYYLKQERLFRRLYNKKVGEYNEKIKRTNIKIFDMNIEDFKSDEQKVSRIMFSVSEFCFYLPFIIALIIMLISYLILSTF